MAAAKAVWRSSSGGGDRREPAWILGFKPKRTNLHEKYDYPESVSSEQAPNIEELVARHRQAKRWRLFCQLVAVILGLASLVVGNFVITLYPSAQPIVTFLVLGTILAVVIRYLLHVKEVRLAQQLRRAGFPEY